MARKGGKKFEALALPHLEAVYRVARRLSHNEHEAEDLVQETFLKAFRAFDSFQEREFGIKPWLFKILHNTFLNRQSRENRAPRAIEPDKLEAWAEPDNAAAGPPELNYDTVDQEVKHAIDQLAPEFRSVLLLWATMELSYQEIAGILGVPIGTVMSRLHRARHHLARTLADYAREQRLTTTKERP